MKNVQDIYPATPMQQFMLLHGLGQSRHDTLFNQFVFVVEGPLLPDAFKAAWEQVLEAHAALRTAFIWKGVDTPQQVVRETVSLGCDVIDLSPGDANEREAQLERLLREDRERNFDFRRAPLMRFTLVKLSPTRWHVVWSSHHLIVDRWCIDQLMDEFQSYYGAHLDGAAIKTVRGPAFKDYVAWLHHQDKDAAQQHWRDYLAGFSRPISAQELLPQTDSATVSATSGSCELDAELSHALRALSAHAGITLSCLVQAGVGMMVNARSGSNDVVFGMTVAGRPAELTHVEDIIGSFISTLPVRMTFTSDTSVMSWLKALNATQFANAGRDYLSPPQFRECARLPADRPMFELLMVWLAQTRVQNANDGSDQALKLVPVTEQFATAYPLTLSVIESPQRLTLRLDTPPGMGGDLSGLLDLLYEQLTSLAECAPERSLAQFDALSFRTMADSRSESHAASFAVNKPSGVTRLGGREDVQLDAMIEVLRGEWQTVLMLDGSLDEADDFFDVGGDSLKAAALHTRLEAATRKAIPLLSLFERPTLGGMAATLAQDTWPLRDGIAVPLRVQGEDAPLFCVASPEVNTLGYAMLARHLPERRNLVLLQAPPRSDELEQLHPDELEEFAGRYIEALRDIQPKGPYTFLSMCSGAHIAFHMVAQLEKQGEDIRFAGVINTWSLYSISWRFYLNRLSNVASYYAERIGAVIRSRQVSAQPALATEGPDTVAADPVKGASAPVGKVVPAESAVGLNNPWINRVGFARLRPANLSVNTPMTVFRLRNQPYWRIGDPALGWSRLTHNTRLVHVDGDDHDAILREPYVQQIAVQLDGELERCAIRNRTEQT